MKNLRWIIFLFCIALQIFLWLAPDTDFVDGIFYVNDVGGTVGKKPYWEVPGFLYLLWFSLLFTLPRNKCIFLILLSFIGIDFTENLYMYNLHINAEQYPLQDLPKHLIESFYWYYLKGLNTQPDVYIERILNFILVATVDSLIIYLIIFGIKKGFRFLFRKIKR